ncbi:TlpA family protein disulfide reductase [Falsibacillus pallidus]|uniref:TlpA family protein disulfide reductase n=1 Tax=Falsibacillus pallidus TaxID=493781 RepID=UPI003D9562C4
MFKKIAFILLLGGLCTAIIVNAAERPALSTQPQNEALSQTETTDTLPGLKIGEAAPNFSLTTTQGKNVSLQDYKGKRVLLNFWAPWCPPCKMEIPELEKFSKTLDDQIVLLTINIDPMSNVKGFAQKYGATFPILLDKKDEVNQAYKLLTIPTTYLIDEKGTIINKHIGAMTFEDFQKFTK